MAASEVAQRYAQGLFQVAQENATIQEKREQAEGVLEAVEQEPDLLVFLRAVKISKKEKKEVLCRVFKDYADKDMLHFLELLVDKDRTYYLKEILDEFIRLSEDSLGIQRAYVDSARPLSEEDMKRISEALQKKTGKQIILKNRINPALIAGIKVTVGNNVTDATMKTRIENMREALLKGGQA